MRGAAKIAAGTWFSIAGMSAAGAQTLSIDAICPTNDSGVRRFLPGSMMIAAIDAAGPSRKTMDVNGDFTETELERIEVIVKNPCASGSRCSDDNPKIVAAQLLLAGVFDRTDVTIVRKRPPPSVAERQREPWLDVDPAADAAGSIAELLDPLGRYLSVSCASAVDDTPGTTGSGRATELEEALPAGGRERPMLRVTSKLEELTRTPAQDIKSVDAATISIAKDKASSKATFAIDAIIGLNIPLTKNDALIPFVQYQRTSVRDLSTSPAVDKRSPDKLGIGAVASLELGRYDQLDIAPLYVVDYEHDSRVVSTKINWIPGFLRRVGSVPVARSLPLLKDLLYWGITPRALLQGSHVFDAGANPDLRIASNYFRVGGDLSLELWGTGPLSNFTGSVAYKRLFRVTRGPRDVDLLRANVQYWLDDAQHVSLGYTYERGLDEDTTDRVDDWKLSLGFRF